MGRHPTPTAILKLRGSRHARGRGSEPAPLVGIPDVPVNTPAEALDVWRKTVEGLLGTSGLLTRIDGPQLERYCRYVVSWRRLECEAEGLAAKSGGLLPIMTNKLFRRVLADLRAESRRLDMAMKEIERNFGMTPADRRRIGPLAASATPPLSGGKPKM